MKCINQWLGIIMAVMLAAGSVQVPVYAAETGATVTEAEGETDSFYLEARILLLIDGR